MKEKEEFKDVICNFVLKLKVVFSVDFSYSVISRFLVLFYSKKMYWFFILCIYGFK